MKFGLIGEKLGHSYSKYIHRELGYDYDLIEIEPSKLGEFALSTDLDGFNVTIPYKKAIIQYLDVIDPDALAVGAVNTVVRRDGKLYGYNTDIGGMQYALSQAGISLTGKVVMILGSGGTSCTAQYVAKLANASEIIVVGRNSQINYQNYNSRKDAEIIINTTPVGMYPNNGESIVDLGIFCRLSGVMEVIYNPITTRLVAAAKKRGVSIAYGLKMLVAQGVIASGIFLSQPTQIDKIDLVYNRILFSQLNIVLIGMPGSGKSTIAKALSNILGRQIIDTDCEIKVKTAKDIPTIFLDHGEDYFRKVEARVVEEYSKLSGQIIATGGGVILTEDNKFFLKQNGVVIWLKRDIATLPIGGERPLSKNMDNLYLMQKLRYPLYREICDICVDNNLTVSDTVQLILAKYNKLEVS